MNVASTFTNQDSAIDQFLLFIKVVALFNADQHEEAVPLIKVLVTACPNVDSLVHPVMEPGVKAFNGAHYNEAADLLRPHRSHSLRSLGLLFSLQAAGSVSYYVIDIASLTLTISRSFRVGASSQRLGKSADFIADTLVTLFAASGASCQAPSSRCRSQLTCISWKVILWVYLLVREVLTTVKALLHLLRVEHPDDTDENAPLYPLYMTVLSELMPTSFSYRPTSYVPSDKVPTIHAVVTQRKLQPAALDDHIDLLNRALEKLQGIQARLKEKRAIVQESLEFHEALASPACCSLPSEPLG
ncbi:uncharacterized protein F5147DRAFT_819928 [Suillus discolor]|uniref:COP9 signalosome complex subunit 3 n=1 Tax=Suillus discolor TaxID=1912936 RepID=A0A9P7EXE0_9AGAM|nr:uncharacterized protein F5147DRAFT_778992 [Suillus discolor]XP_041287525.1 uncharacterized protein F5147DRAFT_819928 [Suillus discolor]KAG2094388.1 hypothetical protein F5147DRAFT_778992 [Suillus discolor]KAG2094405.1 hypothetical protein F5147DRAFT_819928 [Suillus discolor]